MRTNIQFFKSLSIKISIFKFLFFTHLSYFHTVSSCTAIQMKHSSTYTNSLLSCSLLSMCKLFFSKLSVLFISVPSVVFYISFTPFLLQLNTQHRHRHTSFLCHHRVFETLCVINAFYFFQQRRPHSPRYATIYVFYTCECIVFAHASTNLELLHIHGTIFVCCK